MLAVKALNSKSNRGWPAAIKSWFMFRAGMLSCSSGGAPMWQPAFPDFAAAIKPTQFAPGRVFGSGKLAPADYMVELAEGHIARGYAGCFDVTPDWHPILDRVGPEGYYVAAGFSGHGFKLSPAVGHMVAALVAEGAKGHPDLPTFRLSRFAEGKPIRGTYGDWLMC